MVRTIFILVTSLTMTNMCTTPITLNISTENTNDTLIIYVDSALTKYNPGRQFTFHADTKLFEYNLQGDSSAPLKFFDSRLVLPNTFSKCRNFSECSDSVKKYLSFSYLKVIGKSRSKTYVHEAKGKSEIIDFFKKGNNGHVLFITYDK